MADLAQPGSGQQDAGTAGRRRRGPRRCRTGTSRVTRRTSASRFPGAPGKYFYVWLDAPIGYYASFKNLAEQEGHRFRRLGRPAFHRRAVPLHRQGHPVFPHAVLAGHAAFRAYRTPTNVFAHGFLTVDGAKMSKSRGTFITAQSYVDTGMNPEWLRATTSPPSSTPAWKTSTSTSTTHRTRQQRPDRQVREYRRPRRRLPGQAASMAWWTRPRWPTSLLKQLREAAPQVAHFYEGRQYSKALRLVMELTDAGERLRRHREAVGTGQGRSQACRPARRLLGLAGSLPPAHRLSQAGGAADGRGR
ncbi:class I tRNA ligase family protein [Cupriavidus basilensis]